MGSERENGTLSWPMGTFDKLSESVRIVWCVYKPHNTKVVPHVTEFLHHGVHGRHPCMQWVQSALHNFCNKGYFLFPLK